MEDEMTLSEMLKLIETTQNEVAILKKSITNRRRELAAQDPNIKTYRAQIKAKRQRIAEMKKQILTNLSAAQSSVKPLKPVSVNNFGYDIVSNGK